MLSIGAPESRLLDGLGMSHEALERLLEQLQTHLAKLGLEIVQYYDNGTWYCVRSIFVAPNELNTEEQAVLATIIALLENEITEHKRNAIRSKMLNNRLIEGNYMRSHKLRQILSTLQRLGFIKRSSQGITYGPRTLIEFSPEMRKELHTKVSDILL